MGSAYFISVDADPDLSAQMDGKALAENADNLEELAKDRGVMSLEDFMGMGGEEEVEEYYEEDDDDEEAPPPEPPDQTWFDPAEGLETVASLIEGVRDNPDDYKDPESLLEDLENLQEILEKALDLGARWHLSVDY